MKWLVCHGRTLIQIRKKCLLFYQGTYIDRCYSCTLLCSQCLFFRCSLRISDAKIDKADLTKRAKKKHYAMENNVFDRLSTIHAIGQWNLKKLNLVNRKRETIFLDDAETVALNVVRLKAWIFYVIDRRRIQASLTTYCLIAKVYFSALFYQALSSTPSPLQKSRKSKSSLMTLSFFLSNVYIPRGSLCIYRIGIACSLIRKQGAGSRSAATLNCSLIDLSRMSFTKCSPFMD